MTSKLIGFRRFNYKRKSDGQTVDACNLYITYPGDSTVVGEVAETVFCKTCTSKYKFLFIVFILLIFAIKILS